MNIHGIMSMVKKLSIHVVLCVTSVLFTSCGGGLVDGLGTKVQAPAGIKITVFGNSEPVYNPHKNQYFGRIKLSPGQQTIVKRFYLCQSREEFKTAFPIMTNPHIAANQSRLQNQLKQKVCLLYTSPSPRD